MTSLFLAWVAPAYASDLHVSWRAPASCADREQLRAALGRELGREIRFGSDAGLSLRGEITPRIDGYALALTTRSPYGEESRQMQARSCAELMRAALLIASLLLTAASEPGAQAPPPSAAAPWMLFGSARVLGDLGSLAAPSLGPALSLGVGLGATRVALGGYWLPPQDVTSNNLRQPAGSLQLMAASASLCQELFTKPVLAPCLQLEAGRFRARGEGLALARSDHAAWWSIGLGARLAWPLARAWLLCLDAAAVVPFVRPAIAIGGLGVVHEVPLVIGRIGLGIEARFYP